MSICSVLLNVVFVIVSLNVQEFCSRVCWLNQRAWSHSTCLWHQRFLRSPSGRRSLASPSAGSWPTSPPTVAMPPSPPSSGEKEACWVMAAGWVALCSVWRGREVGSAPALRAGKPCLSCPMAGWSPESSTQASCQPPSTHPSRNAEACDCLIPTLEDGTPARRTWGEALWVWVHLAAYPPPFTWQPDSSSREEAGDTVVSAGGMTHHVSTMSAWASKKKE